MAVFSQIRFTFAGSFQCRLATERDPTNSSRSDPFGDISLPKSEGWTFAYNEQSFDRIIRFQNPVQLRSALVDPFVPVQVTKIEVQPQSFFTGIELPWQIVPADPLLGLPVSLGDQTMFDSVAGGGAGFEAILNCRVNFGDLLSITPVTSPILKGVERNPDWENEYRLRKPLVLAPLMPFMDLTRFKVLTFNPSFPGLPQFVEFYAGAFSMKDEIRPVSAIIDFSPAGATGLMATMILGWSWTLNMAFTRFDGDTLVGHVEGNLWGIHSDI